MTDATSSRRNGVKRDKGYQVALPKLATMGTEEGDRRRDTRDDGQIVSSHGGGKISAEIPLNAYLLLQKSPKIQTEISILLKAPKKHEKIQRLNPTIS